MARTWEARAEGAFKLGLSRRLLAKGLAALIPLASVGCAAETASSDFPNAQAIAFALGNLCTHDQVTSGPYGFGTCLTAKGLPIFFRNYPSAGALYLDRDAHGDPSTTVIGRNWLVSAPDSATARRIARRLHGMIGFPPSPPARS